MTVQESINATLAQTSRYQKLEGFTKSFRSDDLGNIEEGEEITIPEDYVVISQKILRNGVPVKDNQGNNLTAEFIKVMTNTGRVVNFFPSSLTKVAFRVDKETGKDVTEGRIVRTSGDVVDYVKQHPDMNATMQALKGCTIKCKTLVGVPVREFGVDNEHATKANVQNNNIGEWVFVGDKRPANHGA